jgi:ATP-dependent DNA ligase
MKSWEELKTQLEELEQRTISQTKSDLPLEALQNSIAKHFSTGDTLPQIQPMLAQDTGAELGKTFEKYSEGKWIIEPKINGIRMLMFIKDGKIRLQTRGRSLNTMLFTERTENYPQFQVLGAIHDTILDGEIVFFSREKTRTRKIWSDNDLHLAMSINGGSPEHSAETQEKIGKAHYVAFDVLRFRGNDCRNDILTNRRKYLVELGKALSPLCSVFHIVPQWIQGETFTLSECYRKVVADGGEGLMLKDRNTRYEHSRSWSWVKIKRYDEEVGFISSVHKVGSKRIAGKVGSLQITNEEGKPFAIVGSLSDEERSSMILPNGEINPIYVGRKVLIRYHVRNASTGNVHHARIVSFLDDKEREKP